MSGEIDLKLIVYLVDVLSFKSLTEILQQSIQDYTTNPTREQKNKLTFDSAIVCLKQLIKEEGVEKVLKRIERNEIDLVEPIIKSKTNQN
jgi:transaldolase